jgi:curved DNA-binding protein CbpA
MNTDFDPYIVLGVNKDTSTDDIKRSFKQKSKTAHPDQGGSPEDFDILKKAYEILTDAPRRRMWDEYRLADDLDIENEAKMVASQIAVQVLDTYPDNCNLDKEIAEVLEKCLSGISTNIRDLVQQKERLENRFKAIYKKPVDDFISIDIERAINAKDLQIRQQKLGLEIHKKAFELIKGYTFDVKKLEDILSSFRTRHNPFVMENGVVTMKRRPYYET